MSTKIYNGRIHDKSLEDVYHQLIELKDEIAKMHDQEVYQYLARDVVRRIDSDQEDQAFYKALNDLELRQHKLKQSFGRDPAIDWDFEICLFPDEGRTLAIPYTEKREFLSAYDALEGISNYAFYDNTDEPEDISPDDWNKRGEHWDKVLGPNSIPASRCLTFQVVSNEIGKLYDPREMLKYIPTFESRLEQAARRLHISMQVKITEENHAKATGESQAPLSMVSKAVMAASNDKESQKDLQNLLRNDLLPEITIDHII